MSTQKYRAWSSNGVGMSPPATLEEIIRSFLEIQEDKHHASEDMMKIFDAGIYMRYTGLKDKNGVELCESDIVVHRNHIGESFGSYLIRDTGWTFELHDPKHPEVSVHYISPDKLEVIGNLYQNKGLLK